MNTFYPAMFDLAIQKDAMVVDVWDNINDWEVEEVPSNTPKQKGFDRPRRQAIAERDLSLFL